MLYHRYRHTVSNMEKAGHLPQSYSAGSHYVPIISVPNNSSANNILKTLPVTERPQKKRKKKTNTTKRKSIGNATELPFLYPVKEATSLSDSAITHGNGKKGKSKKSSVLSPGRLMELATPPPRQLIIPLSLQDKVSDKMKKLPLLVAIKPENERCERERFMRASFNYNPYFVYRGYAEEVEKYREPSDKYLPQAVLIMERAIDQFGTYELFEKETGGRVINRSQIYNLVKRYLSHEDLEEEILLNLRDDLLSRGSMSRSKGKAVLNVRSVNLRENWAEGLLRHEIGTHYLRSSNNRYQPWHSSRVRRELGMGPMNPTEEGLASLHSVLFRETPFLWRAALLYYTAYMASKLSFKELFYQLGLYVSDPDVRWDYCIRAKRGQVDTSRPGSFCKDQVYLDGALQLLKRRRILDFHLLVRLGKVAYTDVDRDCVTQIAQLDKTRIPWFMNDLTVYRRQLDHIARTNGLTDAVLSTIE